MAARARIHRPDQGEPRREPDHGRGTRHRDDAVFHGLAQGVEHVPWNLLHLVEKEHAMMREACLARTREATATDERRR